MNNEELSPMPTPSTEEPELVPGGVDALTEDPADNGLGRDLSPEDNPAVDDVLPDEIAEADDKSQAPDGKADAEAGTTTDDEQNAGQEAEDGSVEPPA
jgi:hypothetical protein